MSDAIEIHEYDPRWPEQFAVIARRVRCTLGPDLLVAIEHIGSTAVPGLAAKPVIDLGVIIKSADLLPAAVAGLATIGYVHEGDKGIPDRAAFHWPPGETRHHLYVCSPASRELYRQIAFRNFLRACPNERAKYAALKYALAERYREDRGAYSDAKTDFVLSVLKRAGVE